MKNKYVTPTVTTYFYEEDIVTTSGNVVSPEKTATFKDVWLTD